MPSVLIVDDSPTARDILAAILSSDPAIEVLGVAENGRQGVEMTKLLSPDVITMDINMPLMNGMEATKEIMIESPTPIVIVFPEGIFANICMTPNCIITKCIQHATTRPANLSNLCKSEKHLHAGPSPAQAVCRRRFLHRIRIRDYICRAKQHLQSWASEAEQSTPCLSYKKSRIIKLDPHITLLSRRVLDPKRLGV